MKELVEVEMVSVLEVEEATRLVRSVEVATPLMVVVRTAPDVERAFEVMMEEVATTPFTVEVRMFPAALWVKELMILASEEETPLTMVWMRLAEEDAVLEVMILEVPTDPPTFEVSVLPVAESVLVVVRLVTVKLVVVAEVTVSAPMKEEANVAPFAERLVVLAFVAVSAEMNPEEKVRPVPEIPVVLALESVVCPVTESVVAVVVASVEVPVIVVLPVVSDVMERLGLREMVEVLVKRRLAPCVRYDTGELKKEFQLEEEAVRGIL